MNPNKIVTYYGRDIEEGSTYYVVYKNNDEISEEVHGQPLRSRAQIATVFQSRSGAEKYIKRKPASQRIVSDFSKKVQQPVPVVKVKTPEELLEEEIKALPKFDQLLRVTDRASFNLWLLRNKHEIYSKHDNNVFNIGIRSLITFDFSLRGVPFCCGGRELGGHSGTCEQVIVSQTSEEMRFVLFKYLAEEFDNVLRRYVPNYGIISYVRNPGQLADASARLGMVMNFSKYFQNVTRFSNPNGGRHLDIYVVNEEWPTNM